MTDQYQKSQITREEANKQFCTLTARSKEEQQKAIESIRKYANAIDAGGVGNWTTQSTLIPTGVTGEQYTVIQEKLDSLIETLVYNRATPTAIYVGYKALRRLMTWNIGIYRTERDDKALGNGVPAKYLSQAGELDIVMIPGDALNDAIFVVDETRYGYKAFKNRG